MCEGLGGYLSGSLAIQGDAIHMLSDVASYLLAILALWAAEKRPNKKYTFGFSRAEPLGALGTFVFIWCEIALLITPMIFSLLSNLSIFHRGATLFLMQAAGERMRTLQFEINDIAMMIGAVLSYVNQ